MKTLKQNVMRVRKFLLFPVLLVMVVGIIVGNAVANEIDDIIPFVIQAESSGNPNAVGKGGEIGLMQISPIVLKEWNSVYAGKVTAYAAWLDENIDHSKEFICPFTGGIAGGIIKNNILRELTMQDLIDQPAFNKAIGTWYLKRLQDHYLKDIQIRYVTHPSGYLLVQIAKSGKIYHSRKSYENFGITKNLEEYYDSIENYTGIFDDIKLMLILSAYNGGITRLRKNSYDINKMPRETREYTRKIMKAYKQARITREGAE